MVGSYNGNWWALGLRAASAIIFGVIALTMPGAALAAIVILFGVYAFADGIFSIIAAFRGVQSGDRWGAMLIMGLVSIAAGLVAFLAPGIGALALVYLVAGWALITGAFEIAAAIRLRKIIEGEWMLIIGGILSIVLAILIAVFPGVGAITLAFWLGAYALVYGIVNLVLAFKVRRWTHAHAVT
ncbi:MAG TPA: HdeD family acid-resistance protein [Gemmatimonadaceae bacterium]|jgi:uncharacterized membrane protein HdeD (DUF308 family)